jgi:hypothetical protein
LGGNAGAWYDRAPGDKLEAVSKRVADFQAQTALAASTDYPPG